VRQPLVSIVTPSYNQARWLGETLDSVAGQDYPRIEHLVVDGGSADGSIDVIRSHEQRLASWWVEPGTGQATALNRGFARARGALLTWINSDDTLLPGAVSALVAEFERDPALVLVYGDALYTDEESRRTGYLPSRPWDVPLMLRTFECHVVQPASMFSRAGWEAAGPLCEEREWFFDFEFFMALSRVGKARQLHEPLATYRVHPASKSSGSPLRRAVSLERLAEDLPRSDLFDGERARLARATRSGGYLAAGEDYYAALETGRARACLWKGLVTYPPNATPRKLSLALKSLLPRRAIAGLRAARGRRRAVEA
jgi:glycosyltransferase involved in cell wall biosynthesis